MNKKRSYWALLGVMVLVGAFLMVFIGSQNQLPVVPDVNAQMTEYNFSGNIYGQNIYTGPMSYVRPDGIFDTAMFCGGSDITSSTCDWNCSPTFSNCGGSVIGGSSGNTMLFCPTSMNCGGQTSLNCTGYVCGGGGNTMLFCPTSMNCGSQTTLNCTALACGGGTSGICSSGTYAFCIGGETSGICGSFFKFYRGGDMPIVGIGGSTYSVGCYGGTYSVGFGGMTSGGGCSTCFCGMSLGGYQSQFLGTGYQGISGYTATPGW